MKVQRLLIFLFMLVLSIPAVYVVRWLQKIIKPRQSFAQLLLYMLATFALVFLYTFLMTLFILKLFPIAKR